jgi:hypothetical protein
MEILEVNRPLTVEEIEDLWELDTNSWRNRQLFVCAPVPEAFMRKHWPELSEKEHHNYFVHQKPSTQFLLDYWPILTENERKACLEHQKLSMEFLQHEWVHIGETNPNGWLIVAQKQLLTPAFITLFWPIMDWWWKVKCIEWQQKFPARLVIENWEEANHSLYIAHHQRRRNYCCEDLTMAELPEYLSCELEGVRISAEEWLCELQRREQHAYNR